MSFSYEGSLKHRVGEKKMDLLPIIIAVLALLMLLIVFV